MYNKVILLGNLGKDPEVREVGGDNKVASFSLATSKSYKDKDGEKKTETQWHNIVAWRHLAKLAELYMKKGERVQVEGELTYRTWDKDDGTKGYATEIVASNIQLLEKKSSESKPAVAIKEPADMPTPMEEDDLPF